MKAYWNNTLIATSDNTVVVEGNHYFPPDAVKRELLRPSDTRTHCPWKGDAQYFDFVAEDEVRKDIAWTYPQPKQAAAAIKDHLAFVPDVTVKE